MQFIGNIFVMIGAAIFIISINTRLGLLALIPLVVVTDHHSDTQPLGQAAEC